MSRLQVTLDGKPVYLYEFIQGSYEDRRNFICAHVEELSKVEILARVRAAVKTVPEKMEHWNYSLPPGPDLFEQTLIAAGFVVVDDEILGLWFRNADTPATEREYLEQSLKRDPY